MTEQEPEHELLSELLDNPGATGEPAIRDDPILTRRDEQRLLDEANQVGPPTLVPLEISLNALHSDGSQRTAADASFGAEAIELVRRHPMISLLAAAGLAYLLTRRRKA